jgi:hypothetical protein
MCLLAYLEWLNHGRFVVFTNYQSQGVTVTGLYPNPHWHDPNMVNGYNPSDGGSGGV